MFMQRCGLSSDRLCHSSKLSAGRMWVAGEVKRVSYWAIAEAKAASSSGEGDFRVGKPSGTVVGAMLWAVTMSPPGRYMLSRVAVNPAVAAITGEFFSSVAQETTPAPTAVAASASEISLRRGKNCMGAVYLSLLPPERSSTAASSPAITAMFTMSLTGACTLAKWTGLLRPICIGPTDSAIPISSIMR